MDEGEGGTPTIDVHQARIRIQRQLADLGSVGNASIDHQDVQMPVRATYRVHQDGKGGGIGNVAGYYLTTGAQQPADLVEARGRSPGRHDERAGLRQSRGGHKADAAGSAGHQRDLAVQGHDNVLAFCLAVIINSR